MLFFFFSFLIYLQKRERNPLKLCQGMTLLDDARHGCKLMTLNCAVQQAEGGGLDECGGGGCWQSTKTSLYIFQSKIALSVDFIQTKPADMVFVFHQKSSLKIARLEDALKEGKSTQCSLSALMEADLMSRRWKQNRTAFNSTLNFVE